MIKTPLTATQARAVALLMQGELSGPELRKALGVRPEGGANFSRFLGRLRRAGSIAEQIADDGHGTRIYSLTDVGRAALARTFDGAIAGTHEQVPATTHEPPARDYKPFKVEIAEPSSRPDGEARAALKAAFEKVDAPFARHIARYLPRGEVQEEARHALDQLRKAITAITGGSS
jgi:DNA-binding PadR family transcriptional regulator